MFPGGSPSASLQNSAALSDAIRDLGFATWNVEYRRIDEPGGGWPGTFVDIGHAVDFLRELEHEHSLDLNRLITVGHSAGGHLALWAAGRHRIPPNSPLFAKNPLSIRGSISLGGPGDLAAIDAVDEQVCGTAVIAKLVGGTVEEEPQRFRAASPAEMLPIGVRQILITGSHDQAVPIKYGNAYAELAERSGDDVKHIVVENAAHHEYMAPGAVTWSHIRESVESLLGSSEE